MIDKRRVMRLFRDEKFNKCNNIIGSQKTIVIANKNGRRNYHIRLMDNGKVDLVGAIESEIIEYTKLKNTKIVDFLKLLKDRVG